MTGFIPQLSTALLSYDDTNAGGNTVPLRDANGSITTNRFKALLGVDNSGGQRIGYAAKTVSFVPDDTKSIYSVDATSGAVTVTLPTAVAPNAGLRYTFKKIDASANGVIVDGNASETIDGALTKTLGSQWAAITIVSNGTNWLIESEMGTIT